MLVELKKFVPIEKILRVQPSISNAKCTVIAIYFAFFESCGVVSGGACGPATDLESIYFRAVCELSRHALGARKIRLEKVEPTTFYERRLAHFAMTTGGTFAVKNRISQSGCESVLLPDLEIDECVPHDLSDLVSVHRCYFRGQPPFVGGDLERLCL